MIKIKKLYYLVIVLFTVIFIRSPVIHAASVGQIYNTSDYGFTRVLHTSNTITYGGSWLTTGTVAGHQGYGSNFSAKFSFTGTTLRIVGGYNNLGNPNVGLLVDGIQYYFSEYSPTLLNSPYLVAQVTVSSGTHNVEITSHSGQCYLYAYEYSSTDVAPTVLSVLPASGRTDVGLSETICLNFDQAMKSTPGAIRVNGVLTPFVVSNKTVTITYTLKYDTTYTILADAFFNTNDTPMYLNYYSWSFTTVKDTTPLEVQNIKPPPDSIDIPIDQIVEITFNKNVDSNTLSKVNISSSSGNLSITKLVEGNVLKISFNELLDNLKTYNLHIEDVADTLGNKMVNPVDVKFTTAKAGPLTLTSYKPPSGIVPLNQTIELVFSGNVDPASIKYKFYDENDNEASSTFKVIGNKVTIVPVLLPNKDYTFSDLSASSVGGDVQNFTLSLTLHVMSSSGDGNIDNIVSKNVSMFTDLKSYGLNIILMAIGLGLIFVGSKWLWKKLKIWLHKA